MRIGLLVAASTLLVGCSSGAVDDGQRSSALSVPSTTPTSSTAEPKLPTSGVGSPAPDTAPVAGTGIADVVAWVEAGRPADVGGYRTMTRDGAVTPLGDGVAFTTAGTEANCVTNEYQDGALACLVKLTNPPPRPPGIETAWKNNWVDFAGTTVDVGSPHGDPGPFGDGVGTELPTGEALAFGDYRCRADPVGLFCVDYAHQTAVHLSATGVDAFGCLQQTTPPADIGIRFTC